jgi:sigma-54 dependent transcriptional regulator, acetoin dehydrogenase operon transcriptional activator AcoR
MAPVLVEKIVSNKENLKHILDNLKEGIIAHDMNREIFFFNREAEKITGYSREEVLGRDCHEVFGGPFCSERCSFCNHRDIPIEKLEYNANIVTKQGEDRRIEMSVTVMKGDKDQLIGVLASFRDLTDLLRLKIQAGKLNSFSNIIGQDIRMIEVFQQISDVSGYDYPVHIYGETGTGKELVAAAIHNESKRGGAPFVPINCGALPETLIESELFGHVKGAFTGAIREKKGRFELADGGTIFLDEVAELSKTMQVKLLRFLQEGKFEKVGGEKTMVVNTRVISATNKDLKKEVLKKNFRDDLFYRLNVIPVRIPPLRDRKNDIPLLARHFLEMYGEKPPSRALSITKDAMKLMMNYNWPGNVRELQNVIQFAIVNSKGNSIGSDSLPMEFKPYHETGNKRGPSKKLSTDTVKDALRKTGGNKTKAAKVLGVGRATLYRFLEENGTIQMEYEF